MIQSNEAHRCKIQRISAPMAENAILGRLEDIILHNGCLDNIRNRLKESHKEEIADLQSLKKSFTQNLIKIKDEIERVTESLIRVRHKKTLDVLEKKLRELLGQKKSIEKRITRTNKEIKALKKMTPEFSSERELFDAFWKGWKKVNLAMKRNLMNNIFDKVVVSERGLEAYFTVFEE